MIERLEDGLIYYQTFDADREASRRENRLVSVTVGGQMTQFVYDGDGILVKKIKPDGSSTTYIRGIYEVDKSSSGVITRTVTYYPAGGAMRIDNSVYYVLKDRLGSAYATTDASGNVVGEMRYYASGETRLSTGNMFTDKLFTGQREIAGLGIYHFGARFYSPELGRFLSADPMGQNIAVPQAFNRYSYALNNPVRYTDPTGYWFDEGCGTGGGGGGTGCNLPPATSDPSDPWSGVSGGAGSGGGGDGEDGSSSNGEPRPPLLPLPDAYYVSLNITAGVYGWYGTWSFDVVITDYEIGVFSVPGIGPGFDPYEIPSTIRQEKMDTALVSPQIGATLYGGALWGEVLRDVGVNTYEGPAEIYGGSFAPTSLLGGLGVAGEYFKSVDRWSGEPNGDITGVGAGVTAGSPFASVQHIFSEANNQEGLSYAATSIGQWIGILH